MKSFLLTLTLFYASTTSAITNGYAPNRSDRRFDAVGAFATIWRLGFEYSPPQADAGPNNWFCSATLIRPNIAVLAAHCITPYGPSAPYAIRFRRALNGTLGTVEEGPASFYHAFVASLVFPPDGTDIVYAYLTEPVPHISPIPYTTLPLAVGDKLLQAGWGRQGPEHGEGPMTELLVCENVAYEVFFYQTVNGQPYEANEYSNPCGTNNNDSGGGNFSENPSNGALTLFGVTHDVVSSYRIKTAIVPPAETRGGGKK